MNKVILKSALITVAAVIFSALLVFSLWILCSPQTMATSCEKTGNYSLAVTCANLRYSRTKSVDDLARCAEDGILSGKDKYIVDYCEKLTAHESFTEVCAKKDRSLSGGTYDKYRLNYKSYICGHLAAAEYRTGNTEYAVNSATLGGVQSFTKLVIAIAEREDAEAAEAVLNALDAMEQTEQVKNLSDILKKYV